MVADRDRDVIPAEPELPRFSRWLRPVVDAVARKKSGVHRKLLFGFLVGALLLVAMAVLSLIVIRQMDDRMAELNHARVKSGRAQEMLYAVTAQSHYRAMALLLPQDAGAPFRGDNAVIGVLLHQDPVAQADAEGSAAAPLADHRAEDRHAQERHGHLTSSGARRSGESRRK